eukprot:scaffold323_cov414-Prasinococcus_capsulatus_cf.AAC.15
MAVPMAWGNVCTSSIPQEQRTRLRYLQSIRPHDVSYVPQPMPDNNSVLALSSRGIYQTLGTTNH